MQVVARDAGCFMVWQDSVDGLERVEQTRTG